MVANQPSSIFLPSRLQIRLGSDDLQPVHRRSLEDARAVPVPALAGHPHPGRRRRLGPRPDTVQRRAAVAERGSKISPGTLKNVQLTLTPVDGPAAGGAAD